MENKEYVREVRKFCRKNKLHDTVTKGLITSKTDYKKIRIWEDCYTNLNKKLIEYYKNEISQLKMQLTKEQLTSNDLRKKLSKANDELYKLRQRSE